MQNVYISTFAGDECRRDLNQYYHYASPTLTFFKNSLVLDTRLKVSIVTTMRGFFRNNVMRDACDLGEIVRQSPQNLPIMRCYAEKKTINTRNEFKSNHYYITET